MIPDFNKKTRFESSNLRGLCLNPFRYPSIHPSIHPICKIQLFTYCALVMSLSCIVFSLGNCHSIDLTQGPCSGYVHVLYRCCTPGITEYCIYIVLNTVPQIVETVLFQHSGLLKELFDSKSIVSKNHANKCFVPREIV